ncbi:MAG: ParB N-terminal domain-containing protein [Smithella sp.]
MNIKINDIVVNNRKRKLNENKVKELAESMKIIGQLEPITVTSGNVLLAGLHRIEAAKMLGWDEIKAELFEGNELECELAEIDENLMRNDLTVLEQGEHLARRQELSRILKGDLKVVEGITIEQMAKLLDQLAGIDVWYINKLNGIRGIASRIQTGSNYKTFTIRKTRDTGARTEYEKRKIAIEKGYLYPYLTVQAYVAENGKLLSFAVAKTEDIIDAIDHGLYSIRRTGQKQIGQAEFYVVNWDDMKKAGYEIIIVEKKPI